MVFVQYYVKNTTEYMLFGYVGLSSPDMMIKRDYVQIKSILDIILI